MFTDTGKGYCVDDHGRKHYSIHPRVHRGGKKSDTSAPRRRKKGHLAKAEARRNARRQDHVNNPSKVGGWLWKTPGSMKWK